MLDLLQEIFVAIHDIGATKEYEVSVNLLKELFDYILEEDEEYYKICPSPILKKIDFIYDKIYDFNPTYDERVTLYSFMVASSNIAIFDSLSEEDKEEILPQIYKTMLISEYYTTTIFREDFRENRFEDFKKDAADTQVLVDNYLNTRSHESATLATLRNYIFSKVDEIQKRYNLSLSYPIK